MERGEGGGARAARGITKPRVASNAAATGDSWRSLCHRGDRPAQCTVHRLGQNGAEAQRVAEKGRFVREEGAVRREETGALTMHR